MEILYGFCELFYNYCPLVTGDGVGLRSARAACGDFPVGPVMENSFIWGFILLQTWIGRDNEW